MATLFPADGGRREIAPANGKVFTLKELQTLVGGYIQVIQVDEKILIMDEDGKSKGKSINLAATAMLMGIIALDDEVVGDVLLTDNVEFK